MRPFVACLLAVLFVPHPAPAQPADDRPADALLQRTDLQAVVDAQVRRDGAALIERLDASDPTVRARAAFALASVQDTAAISSLLPLLRDSVPEVRADAAFALGQMPTGVPPSLLLDALGRERDRTVQRRLVEAVGKTGDAAALTDLLRFGLPDALDPDVALAIARFGLRDVLAPDTTSSTPATTLALDWLTERLRADAGATRRYAAYFFGRMGAEVWKSRADTLRAVLDESNRADPAAMHLIRALGRLGDRSDAGRLQRWLIEAPDWRTRVNAARALAPLTGALRSRERLQAALDDSVGHVAVAAARSLAEASWRDLDRRVVRDWIDGHPDRWRVTAPLLQGAARHGRSGFVIAYIDRWHDQPVPYAALLGALAPLDTAAATERLDAAARHGDPRVAAAALSALADRWDRRRTDAAPAQVDAYFARFASGVTRADVATVNAAAPALTDSLFRSRHAADTLAATYERLASPDDLEAMTALLDALGRLPAPVPARVDTVLRRTLTHPHPALRSAAASALSRRTGQTVSAPPTDPPTTPAIDWPALQALGPAPAAVLQTERGTVIVTLDATQAPQTVQTICGFARDGRYDGVPFHRVVPNFVAQGGDFTREDGWGGPGFFIRSEFTRIPFGRGVIGMASAGKDTEGSQFFLTHSMQPHLDGRYTAFGAVSRGLDAMDRIQENDLVTEATCRPTE